MTLAAARLTVRYGTRRALGPASFAFERGELIGLVGPNGAGKSSLLKAVAGLVACAGEVLWDGTPLAAHDAGRRARLVAYLAQDPALHWPLAARDLVALGRLPHRAHGAVETEADEAAIRWALEQTEAVELAERSIAELSSGERARVLLARALAVAAPVLLADEPVAMLDPYHQLEVMSVLASYAANGPPDAARAAPGAIVVAVLHDLALAARFCDRVLLLDSGTVVADGPPEATLSRAALARHYRIEPFLARHDGEPLIVPWRRLERR